MGETVTRERITQLTQHLSHGDGVAAAELVPLLYEELRQIAARRLRAERLDHTLEPTAVVNEVYLRLVDAAQVDWRGRAQFLALAARQMRLILVDHARRRAALKRGGAVQAHTLDSAMAAIVGNQIDLLTLHEALEALQHRSERQARVVELRYFAGLSVAECAAALEISETTVKEEWAFARAWLRRALTSNGQP